MKGNKNTEVVFNKTYQLLNSSVCSIVASGTATLETALFNVPQIVCYRTSFFNYFIARFFIKIKFISLVNIIMGKEIVKEIVQNNVNSIEIEKQLVMNIPDGFIK